MDRRASYNEVGNQRLQQDLQGETFAGENRAAGGQIIDPVLTNVARRYQAHGFAYDQVVANQPVNTISGQYPTFPKWYWFANEVDNEIEDRAPSKEVDFEWSTDTYRARKFGFKVSISDDERANANPALRLETSKTQFLSLRQAIAREVRLANKLRDVTNGGGLTAGNETTPSNKWDTTSSNPDNDIRAAALSIYNAIGYNPNVLILPYPVAYNLATQHGTDTFRGSMLYTVNGQDVIRLGAGILPAEIHGMRVIVVSGPQVATGREPGTGSTYSEIWGKHARLLYADPNAPWGTPSVLYGFQFMAPTVTRWRNMDPDVDYIREMERTDEKIVAPDAGWVLSAVIS